MQTEKHEIGRVAYREEGEIWNAYWARRLDSMEGATFLGSIRMNIVCGNPERKKAFMDLMNEAFGDAVEEVFGVRPAFHTRTAPGHERPGRA
ncbi:MAG: hypothetical protein ACREIB_09690 [Pseudomonadota bacterium]